MEDYAPHPASVPLHRGHWLSKALLVSIFLLAGFTQTTTAAIASVSATEESAESAESAEAPSTFDGDLLTTWSHSRLSESITYTH